MPRHTPMAAHSFSRTDVCVCMRVYVCVCVTRKKEIAENHDIVRLSSVLLIEMLKCPTSSCVVC